MAKIGATSAGWAGANSLILLCSVLGSLSLPLMLPSLLVFSYWVLSECLGMDGDIPVRPILGPLRPEAAKVGRDTGELHTRSAEIH